MESVEHSIFTHVKTFTHQTEVSGSKENVCKNCQKKLATAATPDVSGPEKYSSANLNRYIYQSSNRISVNFQPNYNRQVQNFYLRNYPTLFLSLIQTFQKKLSTIWLLPGVSKKNCDFGLPAWKMGIFLHKSFSWWPVSMGKIVK